MASESDAEIYRRHAHELARFASVLVGPSDAADVVSDAVVQALSSESWPKVVNHRAYLYRAVANAANARARSDGRRTLESRSPFRRNGVALRACCWRRRWSGTTWSAP